MMGLNPSNESAGLHGRADFLQFPAHAVAIVTGAASGIGRQTALDLSHLGVAVSCWDISGEGIAQTERDICEQGGVAIGLKVDVADSSSVARAIKETIDELGECAFLVNNAGPPSDVRMPFNDALLASLGSVQQVTQAWLRTAGSKDGNVVNVSSVAGPIVGTGAGAWYPAAKAGIAGLTRHLAITRPNGIRVNTVAPGLTETARTGKTIDSTSGREIIKRNPFGRPGLPTDVSAAVVFLLAPVSRYINGILMPIDGGSILVQ